MSDETGSLTGRVTDDQLLPIRSALVGILELGLQTTSDDDGAYTFNLVPPGTYRVTAAKLGFEGRVQTVTVAAGAVTRASLLLNGVPDDVAHHVTRDQAGLLKCSVRWSPGVPTGGAGGLPESITGVALCGLAAGAPIVNDTIGDRYLLHWRLERGATEVLLEQGWQSNQAFAKGLSVYLEVDGQSKAQAAYGRVTGPSPLAIHADEGHMARVRAVYPEANCAVRACAFQTRVFVEAGTTGNAVDVGLVADQKFTQYLTAFYAMGRPAGFSALAEAGA